MMTWPRSIFTIAPAGAGAPDPAAATRAWVAALFKNEVGGDSPAKEAEQGLRSRPRHPVRRQAHAQERQGVLHRLDGPRGDGARRARDLEDQHAIEVGAEKTKRRARPRRRSREARRCRSRDGRACRRVPDGEEGGEVLGGDMVGAADIEFVGKRGQPGVLGGGLQARFPGDRPRRPPSLESKSRAAAWKSA